MNADHQRELDERRLQVIAEQARGLRWQVGLAALVIVAIVWASAPAAWVLGWFAAVIATREWRAAVLQRYAKDRETPIAQRLANTVRWNLLIGAANGSAALFMLGLDTTLDAVLTMVLVSWGAGAVSTSSTLMRAFIAYASLLFVPTALMWAFTGPWLGWGVGALVLMFFGVQIRFARGNLETFEASFRIREENEALAQSLAAERSELAQARDAAVAANRDKSRFLAAASHDLRQPLQALTLNAGELARAPLPAALRPIVDDIGTSIEHLRQMLDALLDLSKLDAGMVVSSPQRVRLDVMLAAITASFRAAAVAKGLSLSQHCPAGLAVMADPELLRRLLANLIDNAIKFTRQGSVKLRAEVAGDAVRIEITDTGPGIAPEHHALIFEDMVQLSSAGSDKPSGHGLGLGIVRRAAALMNTELVLDSAPGRGTSLAWTLPLAGAAQNAGADEAPAADLRGVTLLVLDDDAMVCGAYANALAALGAQVRTAATLDDALAKAEGLQAALVDWRLTAGSINGFDAIAALRARQPGLAAVMVSADTGTALAEQAAAQGVALLRKPVDMTQLGRSLTAALQRQEA